MGIEENKRALRELLEAIEAGDRARIAALFAKDARWVIPRSAPPPHAGTHHGAEHIADMMVSAIEGSFVSSSIDWRPGRMVGEGDLVMAEANLRARTPGGETYDNEYVFVAEFDPASRAIVELREHVDTKYAASFFGG
jgi:ketosteroid isomerase-like protein